MKLQKLIQTKGHFEKIGILNPKVLDTFRKLNQAKIKSDDRKR